MNVFLTSSEWWTLATACMCGLLCGVAGCYLVLRRMSLLGDAITHAILPGLAGAFLLSGTRDTWAMLLGALVVGLLTAAGTSWLSRVGRVPSDAAMGVVFTSLFAAGVLLISRAADKVDLDPGCVLYGLLEFVDTDRVRLLGIEMPRAFATLAGASAIMFTLLTLFWKELKLVSFDAALATSMGFSAGLIHYGAIAMIAGAAVASFEAVGSILVVSMLIGPPATASLLTQRLGRMVFLAGIIGIVSGAVGTIAAVKLSTSIAGTVSVAVGAIFVVALVCSPSQGLLASWLRRSALTLRVRREDIMGSLYRLQQEPNTRVTRDDISALLRGPWGILAQQQLLSRKHLQRANGGPVLTQTGLIEAERILRAHRLWESYLWRDLALPVSHVHDPSERMEHFITDEMARDLAAHVSDTHDPQGRPIPRRNSGAE
ncbi:MAG TPA: metal ABC transporter permease [Phycisphaerales bacterium]|nr:metal ABC transporter permease [Phycisphaerales bacterium]